jgi:hypothetical protein
VNAQREDTISRKHFREWITNHIDRWFAFTQELGLGIEMEDIVLVTGRHRTRSWSNISFSEVQAKAKLSLGVEVAGSSASVHWRVSSRRIQGAVLSHRPNGEVCVTKIHRYCAEKPSISFPRTYLKISAYLSEDFVSNVTFSEYFRVSEQLQNQSQIDAGMTASRRDKWLRYPVLQR